MLGLVLESRVRSANATRHGVFFCSQVETDRACPPLHYRHECSGSPDGDTGHCGDGGASALSIQNLAGGLYSSSWPKGLGLPCVCWLSLCVSVCASVKSPADVLPPLLHLARGPDEGPPVIVGGWSPSLSRFKNQNPPFTTTTPSRLGQSPTGKGKTPHPAVWGVVKGAGVRLCGSLQPRRPLWAAWMACGGLCALSAVRIAKTLPGRSCGLCGGSVDGVMFSHTIFLSCPRVCACGV